MMAFACGRCDECDGGRGSEFCLSPRGTDVGDYCHCVECGRVMGKWCWACAPNNRVERLRTALQRMVDLDPVLSTGGEYAEALAFAQQVLKETQTNESGRPGDSKAHSPA